MKSKKIIFLSFILLLCFGAMGCEDKDKKEAKEKAEAYLQIYYTLDLNQTPEVTQEEIQKLDPENLANYASKSKFLLDKVIRLKENLTENQIQNLLYGKDIERLMEHCKLTEGIFSVENLNLNIISHNRVKNSIEMQYTFSLLIQGEEKRILEHQGNILLLKEEGLWKIDKNTKPAIKDSVYDAQKEEIRTNKIEKAEEMATKYLEAYFSIPNLEQMGQIEDEAMKDLAPQGLYEHYVQYAPPSIKEGYRILDSVREFCTDTFFEELKTVQATTTLVDNAVKTERTISFSDISYQVKQYDEDMDTLLFQYTGTVTFGMKSGEKQEEKLTGAIQLVELIDDVWFVKGESEQRIMDKRYKELLGKN